MQVNGPKSQRGEVCFVFPQNERLCHLLISITRVDLAYRKACQELALQDFGPREDHARRYAPGVPPRTSASG